MDRSLPVARRTRSRQAEWYKQIHAEIKRNNPSEKDKTTESSSFSGCGEVTGKNFTGSCIKDNESKNLGCTDDIVEEIDLDASKFKPDDCCEYLGSNAEDEKIGTKGNGSSRGLGRVEGEENCSGSKSNSGNNSFIHVISDSEYEENEIFSTDENEEDSDDPNDYDFSGETSDSSSGCEEISDESEEDEEEERQVSRRQICNKGKGEKIELGLKRKKKFGIEILYDSDDCKNNGVSNGNDSSVHGGRKLNSVVNSQYNSEPIKKRIKLGTTTSPVCVDKEVFDNCDGGDDDIVVIGVNKTFGSEDGNDEEHLQCLHGGQPTRKRVRAYDDHEVVKILANSIFDKEELPCEDTNDPVTETVSLPLKFTFGTEEPTPMEKSEEEKELDKLWAEMALALCANDATEQEQNEADVSSEVELDPALLCHQGKHQFILDEEIGIKCKFCSHVHLEIKYYAPPFGRHPWGTSERRDSCEKKLNIFDELHYEDCGYDSQPGCTDMQGTVWNIIPGIGKDMHAHQREGFEFLWKNIAGGIFLDKLKEPTNFDGGSGCIISHAPGTGKTRLAIVFLQTYIKLYPTCRPMIIAPCSMLLSWEAEFRKWKVDIPFHNLNKSKFSGKENAIAKDLLRSKQVSANTIRMVKLFSWYKDSSVLGISYKLFEELVGEDGKRSKVQRKTEDDISNMRKVLLEIPGLLVLDEGHTPRNEQSLIWKALSNIRTEKRIILSGTPFQNNFDELYNTLCLARPDFAKKLTNKLNGIFQKRHGRKVNRARRNWTSLTNAITSDSNDGLKAEYLEELRSMIGPFVHVHKGNILQQRLPGLKDAAIILEPDPFQKNLLEKGQLSGNLQTFSLEHFISLVSVHPALLLKQTFHMEEPDTWGKLKKYRLDSDKGVKTKFVMELIRLSMAMNEKVLVFSQYCDPLKFIGKLLKSLFHWTKGEEFLYMDGKVDADQRQLLIKNFNDKNSESKVMLASTKACSEGINLVGASRVVLLDVVWNPSVERQAISRAYRLGQEKVVYIYHLITSETMEEEKYCRQAEKELLSELVFYSSDRADRRRKVSSNVSEDDEKDRILEQMLQENRLKGIFKKIIYQPKDTNLVESFGFGMPNL